VWLFENEANEILNQKHLKDKIQFTSEISSISFGDFSFDPVEKGKDSYCTFFSKQHYGRTIFVNFEKKTHKNMKAALVFATPWN
jgi:hypothetical protein